MRDKHGLTSIWRRAVFLVQVYDVRRVILRRQSRVGQSRGLTFEHGSLMLFASALAESD